MTVQKKIILPPHSPLNPPRLSTAVVYAVKAMRVGAADAGQQSLFLDWLIVEVCKKDDMPWFPGGVEAERDTALANGKRLVALHVLRALNMPPDKIAAMKAAEDKGTPDDGELPNR